MDKKCKERVLGLKGEERGKFVDEVTEVLQKTLNELLLKTANDCPSIEEGRVEEVSKCILSSLMSLDTIALMNGVSLDKVLYLYLNVMKYDRTQPERRIIV